MKLKILLIFFLVVVLAVYGFFKAVPKKENGDVGPQISISPQFFDFGEVDYGETVEHIFKVKNLGNESLEINRISTSCACTSAKIDKEEISPGEEAELKVVYETAKMSGGHAKGDQERIIYVKSNDSTKPQEEVTIHAYVK